MVKNNVQVDLEHDVEIEDDAKPFKTTNILGRLKRSANYNYLYKKAYRDYLKRVKKNNKNKNKVGE